MTRKPAPKSGAGTPSPLPANPPATPGKATLGRAAAAPSGRTPPPTPTPPRLISTPPPLRPIPTGHERSGPVKGCERGCLLTAVWTTSRIAQPSASGDWAPGGYDPQSGFLFFATGVSPRKVSTTGRVSVVGTREYGLITALDSRTNKQVWQKEVPYLAGFGSGVLATAGVFLFHGRSHRFVPTVKSTTR